MHRLIFVVLAAGLLAACGSDDDDDEAAVVPDEPAMESSEDDSAPADNSAAIGMTTIGALDLELPFPIPGEIPAPADAEYVGESQNSAPYSAVQFSTEMDADALEDELKAFADATDAIFDESIEQITFLTEIDGTQYNVYAWVRTNEEVTILEAGVIEMP